MPYPSSDSADVSKISTLIRQKLDAGISAREMSRASGDVVAHQQFTAVAKGEIKGWPKSTAAVAAYARALGVDARAVVLGFAADLGLDVRDSRSALATQLPATANNLTPEQVGVIRQLIVWLGQAAEADVPQPAEIHPRWAAMEPRSERDAPVGTGDEPF